MLNIDDFTKRLHHLMDYYSLTASSFADKIGVQRSGISHILSGRNKPSLDFVLKISEEFPQVDLYWLLNGEGNFLKTITDFSSKEVETAKKEEPAQTKKDTPALPDSGQSEGIYKIVIFYSNGSFKEFNPAQ